MSELLLATALKRRLNSRAFMEMLTAVRRRRLPKEQIKPL